MDPHLAPTPWLDHDAPDVRALARRLARGRRDATDAARACFEWVRDEVRHSGDHRVDAPACRASDVLRERAGWCHGKAHLLAALLRANGVPAGLAYQRLAFDGSGERHVLHALVAARLPGLPGWYRMDPRGNRPGIDARFDPPVERLAFTLRAPGERDLPGVHADPLPSVVACLASARSWREALDTLPDEPPMRPGDAASFSPARGAPPDDARRRRGEEM